MPKKGSTFKRLTPTERLQISNWIAKNEAPLQGKTMKELHAAVIEATSIDILTREVLRNILDEIREAMGIEIKLRRTVESDGFTGILAGRLEEMEARMSACEARLLSLEEVKLEPPADLPFIQRGITGRQS